MTTFQDGPAHGKTLMLKRSPKFLRVVEAAGKQEFDALDQPEDTPAITENIYAYVLDKNLGSCHINRGRGCGGFYPICEYRFVEKQPPEASMRDGKAWEDWCATQ